MYLGVRWQQRNWKEKKMPFTEIIKLRKIPLKIKRQHPRPKLMPPSFKKYIIGVTNLCHHGQFVICRRKYVSRVLRGILPVTYRIFGATPRFFFPFSDVSSPPLPLFFCIFVLLVAAFSSLGSFSPQIENYLETLFSGNCASDK